MRLREPVDLITMDLSYLAIADAIGQIDRQVLAPAAQLIALVKPTFELHAAVLADQPQQVTAAVQAAARAAKPWLAGPGPAAIAHPGRQRSSRNFPPRHIRVAGSVAILRSVRICAGATCQPPRTRQGSAVDSVAGRGRSTHT